MNYACKKSFEKGTKRTVAGTEYVGANPEYANIAPPYMPVQMAKVTKGVPFVSADKK